MIRKLFKYKGEKIMFRKFYTTILLLLITFSFSLAQSGTGRISGKVIDKQTGEALPGSQSKTQRVWGKDFLTQKITLFCIPFAKEIFLLGKHAPDLVQLHLPNPSFIL